jgi:hypothetical protein
MPVDFLKCSPTAWAWLLGNETATHSGPAEFAAAHYGPASDWCPGPAQLDTPRAPSWTARSTRLADHPRVFLRLLVCLHRWGMQEDLPGCSAAAAQPVRSSIVYTLDRCLSVLATLAFKKTLNGNP